ncbi:MAG TPA: nuclear transport factor 2 family protein [candidate division Zixibacteria bacterium]|nr:nuclear transport factor 2 family protein [candidate division Zixibacteria bacterium]
MTDDEKAVAEANEAFYRAFESLSTAEMEKVWRRAPYIQCIHPGWHILRGWDPVMTSWQRIFENGQEMRFMLTDVSIRVHGDLAWVTLYENIHGPVEGRIASATVAATNVFERGRDGWRLIHHQGCSVAQPPFALQPKTLH